jgi:hypothetical protein
MFKADVSGMLRGEGWVVSENLGDICKAVEKVHANIGHGHAQSCQPHSTGMVNSSYSLCYQQIQLRIPIIYQDMWYPMS